MENQEQVDLDNWEKIQMESPEGKTLGEWYDSLPKIRKGCMVSVIYDHLMRQLPLTEDALLQDQEDYGSDLFPNLDGEDDVKG